MTDNLSPEIRAAREEARRPNGEFGTHARSTPEVELTADVPTFTPAYPLDTFQQGETAVSDGESVVCVCGNSTADDGFGQAGADGRYADLRVESRDPELSDDLSFFICHSCGRVYHGDSAVAAVTGGRVPVVAKYARGPEFDAARDRYWAALDA